MIEAIVFDMDGILIDSEPLWKAAEKATFKKVGLHLTTEMCEITMGYRTSEVIDYWYNRAPWTGSSKQEVLDDLIKNVGDLILSDGKILPGVIETLNLTKKLGLKCAIATSSSTVIIDAVLKKLNIDFEFDAVCSAEHEPLGKPNPAVYIKAAQKLGVDPINCIAIEDSFHGLIAAKAAKMKTIAIPESKFFADPKFQFSDVILKSMEEVNEELIRAMS